MRQVLVDFARKRRSVKRGGDAILVSLSDVSAPAEAPALDVLALDEAFGELTNLDPRLSHVVELKFFAGLSISEAAQALGSRPRPSNATGPSRGHGSTSACRLGRAGCRTGIDRSRRRVMEPDGILRLPRQGRLGHA